MRFTTPLLSKTSEWLIFCQNIKSEQCPHCRCQYSLRRHGSLYGVDTDHHGRVRRGLRFYCSNRYSNKGCGRSFSIYFNTIIPYHTVRDHQLSKLLRLLLNKQNVHQAWYHSFIPFTSQSAYSWLRKLTLNLSPIRHKLHSIIGKVLPTSLPPIIETITILKAHFETPDFITIAQQKLQLPILRVQKISS